MTAVSQFPDFSYERQRLAAYPAATLIGIDEAGRGPWAGPVVAGAAWISPDMVSHLPAGLTDSKKLCASRRQTIYAALLELAKDRSKLRLATAAIDARVIDQTGILPATFRAMQTASNKLFDQDDGVWGHDGVIMLVDGSIQPNLSSPAQRTEVEAIIKGDLKLLSIAAASIMAKVERDQIMIELAKAYPQYGWQNNKGYGTAEHQAALAEHGCTAYHRMSFRPLAPYRNSGEA
ncbi:MAG: ribonuclease HII [Candidatus Puniceispirillum sp. TMED52]|nr:ribonuclease HII [SAR116 cluster bacterium]OUU50437.1 MAG: ribonuclease HII [Candidatus Puniceispirillum sp. TMED52]HCP18478.1 ribonuclease HII [Alphaproteobacteria bacterium]